MKYHARCGKGFNTLAGMAGHIDKCKKCQGMYALDKAFKKLGEIDTKHEAGRYTKKQHDTKSKAVLKELMGDKYKKTAHSMSPSATHKSQQYRRRKK